MKDKRIRTIKKDIIITIKEILISRNEIIAAFIYGSFLYTEDYDDIDVGVFTNCTFHGLEKPDYEFELEQLLSKKLTSKIDLRVIDDAPDKFLYNVNVFREMNTSASASFSVISCSNSNGLDNEVPKTPSV